MTQDIKNKHVKTLPRSDPEYINIFENYKGFNVWFDECSSQYMTVINKTPIAFYNIHDLERNIDFYLKTKELI